MIGDSTVDAMVNQDWLSAWLDILNGTTMTPGDPGFKGFTSEHKLKSHWDNYAKKKRKLLQDLVNGDTQKTRAEIDQEYISLCHFSVINDTVDKNFIIRAIITKVLRRNGIQVLWHSNAPQTWASELRYAVHGMAQINPEILKLDQWAKFRKDFHLESFMTHDTVLYMHLLEDVTMFHSGKISNVLLKTL